MYSLLKYLLGVQVHLVLLLRSPSSPRLCTSCSWPPGPVRFPFPPSDFVIISARHCQLGFQLERQSKVKPSYRSELFKMGLYSPPKGPQDSGREIMLVEPFYPDLSLALSQQPCSPQTAFLNVMSLWNLLKTRPHFVTKFAVGTFRTCPVKWGTHTPVCIWSWFVLLETHSTIHSVGPSQWIAQTLPCCGSRLVNMSTRVKVSFVMILPQRLSVLSSAVLYMHQSVEVRLSCQEEKLRWRIHFSLHRQLRSGSAFGIQTAPRCARILFLHRN